MCPTPRCAGSRSWASSTSSSCIPPARTASRITAARRCCGWRRRTAMPEVRPREFFVAKVTASWRRSLGAIFRTGDWLLTAKQELPHGEFTQMIERDLPFGERVAQRLMAISDCAWLREPTRESVLPLSWTILYQLSRLPERELDRLLRQELITPDLERDDVEQWRRQLNQDRSDWVHLRTHIKWLMDFSVRFPARDLANQVIGVVITLEEIRELRDWLKLLEESYVHGLEVNPQVIEAVPNRLR